MRKQSKNKLYGTKMNKKKIIVTGGSGDLGQALIPKLVSDGYDCISISKKSSRNKLVKNIKCDITNFQKLNLVINKFKPDIIIHLAGLTGNIACETNPKKAFLTNVFGTLNILKSSIKLKPKIIFVSTGEIYGKTKNKVNENALPKPVNIYGITKMLSENLILNYSADYKTPTVILRFSYCYDENFTKRGFSSMFKKAISGEKIQIFGGDQILDLLHFNDAIHAILKSITYNKTEIFNIGSGETQSLISIINKLKKIMNNDVNYALRPYRGFEVKTCKLNINKAKKNLKFKPSTKLDDILYKMVSKWS
jgi:nucleoside-diphosphate-sugar epimerase